MTDLTIDQLNKLIIELNKSTTISPQIEQAVNVIKAQEKIFTQHFQVAYKQDNILQYTKNQLTNAEVIKMKLTICTEYLKHQIVLLECKSGKIQQQFPKLNKNNYPFLLEYVCDYDTQFPYCQQVVEYTKFKNILEQKNCEYILDVIITKLGSELKQTIQQHTTIIANIRLYLLKIFDQQFIEVIKKSNPDRSTSEEDLKYLKSEFIVEIAFNGLFKQFSEFLKPHIGIEAETLTRHVTIILPYQRNRDNVRAFFKQLDIPNTHIHQSESYGSHKFYANLLEPFTSAIKSPREFKQFCNDQLLKETSNQVSIASTHQFDIQFGDKEKVWVIAATICETIANCAADVVVAKYAAQIDDQFNTILKALEVLHNINE